MNNATKIQVNDSIYDGAGADKMLVCAPPSGAQSAAHFARPAMSWRRRDDMTADRLLATPPRKEIFQLFGPLFVKC